MIHVIGDSHTSFFSGRDRVAPWWPKRAASEHEGFEVYYIGPVMAASLMMSGLPNEHREKALTVLAGIPKGSKVLFVAGEIDCRAHLCRNMDVMERLAEWVVRLYGRFIWGVVGMGYDARAWGATPSVQLRQSIHWPIAGKPEERLTAMRYFNRGLRRVLGERFMSISHELMNGTGMPDPAYFYDGCHVSQAAWPFAWKRLRRWLQD